MDFDTFEIAQEVARAKANPALYDAVAARMGYSPDGEARGLLAEQLERNWEISRALWGDHPSQPRRMAP